MARKHVARHLGTDTGSTIGFGITVKCKVPFCEWTGRSECLVDHMAIAHRIMRRDTRLQRQRSPRSVIIRDTGRTRVGR